MKKIQKTFVGPLTDPRDITIAALLDLYLNSRNREVEDIEQTNGIITVELCDYPHALPYTEIRHLHKRLVKQRAAEQSALIKSLRERLTREELRAIRNADLTELLDE